MIRRVACLFIALSAVLFSSSCVLDNGKQKPDHVAFQLDPVLLGLTRVEIYRLDSKGNPIAPALFSDSLRTLDDVANLDARGYGGGASVFSVKGYKGTQMVYEIKVAFNGTASTVQEIKLIPVYSLSLKVADPVDLDKDGFRSGFSLIADVNTNLAVDSVLLRFFWKKEGAAEWESRGVHGLFRIAKASGADSVVDAMKGGAQANGTLKVEAYNRENLLVAEKTLPVREETADEDDPGFHFRLINHTGAFMEASVTVSGQVKTQSLAPRETLLVERDSRPTAISYYASADGDVVVWKATVPVEDKASYNTTLILANNTEEFFVLAVMNNSTTIVDSIIVDQGLPTEASNQGPIPGDGLSYNVGVFNYNPKATVSFINKATGSVATVYPLVFDISSDYGYRYASVVLSNSNWADPSANLFNKTWKLIASGIEPAMKDSSTGALFTDVYARMQGCARDGFITFNANGTFSDNEGPTKCDNTNPQSVTGTWSLNANRTLLTMQWGKDTIPIVFTVGALTPTTLKLSDDKDTWDDGKVHTLTLTFSSL